MTSFVRTIVFLVNSSKTNGLVIALERLPRDRRLVYYPVIRFRAGNQTISFRAAVGAERASHTVNEIVVVQYLEKDPKKAKINSFLQLWFLTLTCLAAGIGFSALGLFFLQLT